MSICDEPHHLRSFVVIKVLRDGPLNGVRLMVVLILLHLLGH